MSVCPFCHQELGTKSLAGHQNLCRMNPKRNEIIKKQKETLRKTLQRKREEIESSEYFTKKIDHKKICKKCGKEYIISCSEYDYEHNYISDFCSSYCSHSFSSSYKKSKTIVCEKCGKQEEVHSSSCRKLCSNCYLEKQKEIKKNKKIKPFYGEELKRNPIIKEKIFYCTYTGNFCKYKNCDCYFQKIGFCVNHSGVTQKFNTLNKYLHFKEESIGDYNLLINEFLYMKYKVQQLIDSGLTTGEVCEKFTGSAKKGNTIFKLLGINVRNLSEATKNSFLTGKHNFCKNQFFTYNFITENHKSWNDHEYFLRSSYEIEYANYLDKQKIDYKVEALRIEYFDTIQNKKRIAIPDFYLPKTNTIVEIKSKFTIDIQNMKDKFKAYQLLGYNTKLIYEHKETNINLITQPKNTIEEKMKK